MYKFKKGDKVVTTRTNSSLYTKGLYGVVVENESTIPFVILENAERPVAIKETNLAFATKLLKALNET